MNMWCEPGYCAHCGKGPYSILKSGGSTLCPDCGHDLAGGLTDAPICATEDDDGNSGC